MRILKVLFVLLIVFVAGCANKSVDQSKDVDYSGTGALNIAPVVFTEGLKVREAVKNECQLLTKIPTFVESYGRGQYATINLQAKKSSDADFLKIEIVDLPSFKKNAWSGRGGQWVSVKGSLIRQGKKTVSFTATRASMGGFMGGYKGTCALLGRCTKTLGKDIAAWLKKPVDGASLGNE